MRLRISPADGMWTALGVLLIAALVVTPFATGRWLGLRAFRTMEVSREYPVAQRFRMNAPNLTAIEIRASAIGAVGGSYRLTLRDRDARNVERSADVRAADLTRETRYLFRFDPIVDSADHEYQLEIAPLPSDPGRGIALWGSKGARDEGSALRINNQPRWASLAFQTHTSATSLLRALVRARDPERPPQWLALIGLIGMWLALRSVLRVVAAPDLMPAAPVLPAYVPSPADSAVVVGAAMSSRDDLATPPAAAR